jgi:hypothetical protein
MFRLQAFKYIIFRTQNKMHTCIKFVRSQDMHLILSFKIMYLNAWGRPVLPKHVVCTDKTNTFRCGWRQHVCQFYNETQEPRLLWVCLSLLHSENLVRTLRHCRRLAARTNTKDFSSPTRPRSGSKQHTPLPPPQMRAPCWHSKKKNEAAKLLLHAAEFFLRN